MMWPILLCSILSLAIVIEKGVFLSSVERQIWVLKTKVIGAIRKGDLKGAVAFCDAASFPLSGILKAGLLQFGRGRTEIQEAMEGASASQVPFLEKGISFLGTMGSIVPLLGFLGTVLGMASALRTFQLRAQAMNPSVFNDIARDVWTALITTGFSLFIAILVFLAYHYFTNRVSDIVFQMERAATDTVGALMDLSGASSAERDEA